MAKCGLQWSDINLVVVDRDLTVTHQSLFRVYLNGVEHGAALDMPASLFTFFTDDTWER